MSVITPTQSFNEELPQLKELYSFELDDFQKYAIHAINKKENVLITAHTGSGKSVPAEYAIYHYNEPTDLVIYTSPIKSLTNQKFYEFQKKFPDKSFGLLTGDIKYNTDANYLLMTTEILRNALMRKEQPTLAGFEQFNLDISRLKCIVFDEIHYINDLERGSVWEESIMWLPNIPLVLLSATIDRATEFASWIADVKKRNTWYLSNERRVVPLEHNMIFCLPKFVWKKPQKDIDIKTMNRMMKWMGQSDMKTKQSNIHSLKHIKTIENALTLERYMDRQRIRLSPRYLMNAMANSLHSLDKLPAVVFLFSRKQVEQSANQIQNSMFPTEAGDSSVSGNHTNTDYQTTTFQTDVIYRAKSILKRLSNWQEYLETAEYNRLEPLLRKGVAYHHSGVHPIFREMIELLFQEGFIRLLFSTETLAVGVNMPARTVVMTSVTKWDGVKRRCLHPHEYTQMAGRAGRRGMDTRGFVYHLFWRDIPPIGTYQHMLSGKPQTLISKFRMSPLTVLRVIRGFSRKVSIQEVIDELMGTMINQEIERQKSVKNEELGEKREKLDILNHKKQQWNTPLDILDEYHNSNKKERMRLAMKYNLVREYAEYKELCELNENVREFEENISRIKDYIPAVVRMMIERLIDTERIMDEMNEISLSTNGNIISQFHEISPYSGSVKCLELLENTCRDKYGLIDIIGTFAGGLVRTDEHDVQSRLTHNCAKQFFRSLDEIELDEEKWTNIQSEQIDVDELPSRGVGLLPWIHRWYDAEDAESCKTILTELEEMGIFLGEWVKLMLKMIHCAEELGRFFEERGKIEALKNCCDIPKNVLKFVVTNQSLYL